VNSDESTVATAAGELDFTALLRILWSEKFLVLLITVACGLLAVVLALTATPIFRAQTVVTEVRNGAMGGAASSLASQLGGLASLAGINLPANVGQNQDAQAVLASRRLLEEFVKRENLLPELSRNAKKQPTLWHAVEDFRTGVVSIKQDKRNGVTSVLVDWEDPRKAAQWATGIVVLANELVRTRALEDSSRNIDYLNKQIAKTSVIEVQRAMYSLIENETKTLMLANARTEYAFTIVDPAVPPEERLRPKRKVMVIIGLALGFALGAAVAFARYAWRRAARRGAGFGVAGQA
jgi:uncharacterized protein involved in exopolysaccharide biosynthesis